MVDAISVDGTTDTAGIGLSGVPDISPDSAVPIN